MGYQEYYAESINDPEHFWQRQADQLAWFTPPLHILSTDSNGIQRWFADGKLNLAYLAVDFHVEQGRGDQAAIFYDSPVSDSKRQISYRDLMEQVARFAGVLRAKGVGYGDRVVVYMPMIPEAVVAMLACARLGAIHSVVFGGFAAHELASRIEDAEPKVVLTASCGIEINKIIAYKPLLDEAIRLSAHQPEHVIVYQRAQCAAELQEGRDYDWCTLAQEADQAPCVPVNGADPLYILYTSGTTGKPKGVVRDTGSYAVALKHSMSMLYDVKPGDVFWAASDVGWVVGHSYIVYGPLIHGCSTVLYEGKPVKTPDAAAFWRVAEEYRVKALFAAPTAFRAIRKEDPEGRLPARYDLSHLRYIFMAGERLDPPTYQWVSEVLDKPVIDHWWQTETGWAIVGNPMGVEPQPTKAGSAGLPMTGFDVRVLDANGDEMPVNQQGSIAIKLPLPPGCLPTIWGDFERLRSGYLRTFPGYYVSGDGGYKDEDGYIFIMGRTDDVINVAGHRLSTGEMEEVVASHPAVAECAVIGIQDPLKGQEPVGLVLLKDGVSIAEAELQQELVGLMRDRIGALACFKRVMVVDRLPKTRSGKILRKLLRQMADGEEYSIPSTIDDPSCLGEIQMLMQQRRIGAVVS